MWNLLELKKFKDPYIDKIEIEVEELFCRVLNTYKSIFPLVDKEFLQELSINMLVFLILQKQKELSPNGRMAMLASTLLSPDCKTIRALLDKVSID